MRDEDFQPVLDRLLATRRAKVEASQGGVVRGLRFLFAGHSSKNRLLAAQLFARELAVDLFQIDLERITGKLSGETEKNLDALFMAAAAADAVLLFDDIDHLFAAPAVEGSGRFPTLDVAQLRQRLEAYNGVLVLGADDPAQVDPRFARQCDEVVELSDD